MAIGLFEMFGLTSVSDWKLTSLQEEFPKAPGGATLIRYKPKGWFSGRSEGRGWSGNCFPPAASRKKPLEVTQTFIEKIPHEGSLQ